MKLGSPHLSIPLNVLILILSVGGLGFLFQFGTALSQEKDTPDILKAALSMALTHTDVAVVNSNQQRLLVKNVSALKTYLERQGWTWRDQLGALVIYRKGDQRLDAICGMYSRNYMICDLKISSKSQS